MNIKSSRSHCLFQILVEEQNCDTQGKIKRAKINLCDLAGSEKINKAEVLQTAHLKELQKINGSLCTLGKVIFNLARQMRKLPIPYRESKLTRLLQDSLQGNTITYIIATITPNLKDIEESINTLKFAERARRIQLKIQPNLINGNDDMTI